MSIIVSKTRNLTGDEIANVNFSMTTLYKYFKIQKREPTKVPNGVATRSVATTKLLGFYLIFSLFFGRALD